MRDPKLCRRTFLVFKQINGKWRWHGGFDKNRAPVWVDDQSYAHAWPSERDALHTCGLREQFKIVSRPRARILQERLNRGEPITWLEMVQMGM